MRRSGRRPNHSAAQGSPRRLFLWRDPCTKLMTVEEINGEVRYQTGEVIIKTLKSAVWIGANPGGIGSFARPRLHGVKMPPMPSTTRRGARSAYMRLFSRQQLAAATG